MTTKNEIPFSTVLEMVEKGFTIRKALKRLNISISAFYRSISRQQQLELSSIKKLNAKYNASVEYNSLQRLVEIDNF